MTWSLYEEGGFLEPLRFSNGKTQEDVVKEVLDSIKEGNKIILIYGICGTGKSAIALNIAKEVGQTSIVVPGKNLQNQYKKDYEGTKYVLKDSLLKNIDREKFPQLKELSGKKEKLKIKVMTGRKNHKCKFLEEEKDSVPVTKREVNAKLNDIFSGRKEEIVNVIGKDLSADNQNIPCKIGIKEKNWDKIKKYLQKNDKVNVRDFLDIKDVKRISIATVCPYWSPVLPERYTIKDFEKIKKKSYLGLKNTKFNFYERKHGCKFYEQFNSYIDSDVIVFNSLKYKLESAINRKPFTEIEIIDECDEFLDSFSNQRDVNIDRLQNSLKNMFGISDKNEEKLNEIREIINHLKRNVKFGSSEIIPLKRTGIYDLFKILLDCSELFEELDEENYLCKVEESARMFEDFFDESYVTFNKKDDNIIASIVTTNLEKKFKEMIDKNKIIVLMSGTLHSDIVLKNVFGLNNFKIIEAETEHQGKIEIQRTGLEINCRYSNFLSGKCSRENYLRALSKCIDTAKKPTLVHVNAFLDLPSEEELERFDIDDLISREKLKEMQEKDKTGVLLVDRFKKGQIDVLFTTKCNRGIDFPGEECNSIVFTKYPNPNVQDAFWKILSKTKPQQYWDFYKDKARRELLQRIYRGLRHKEDHVYVLSPDVRVLDFFEDSKF